jgi:diaminohydroxyphosphoribosylaminopyrimidine deaminase/5-amino-6-(5-phosphoribosylamino)uracil reductase
MPNNNQDILFMRKALALARQGRGMTSPNPMVGAVLVKAGRVIATGWHRQRGTDHAEVIAFNKAGAKARGATLYLNLEPCHHDGYTPPCVERVLRSGINKIVVAMKDPNPLTNGKSLAKLKRAGIRVKTGVLEKEARLLNEVFVKFIKDKMPFVVAKSAITLDGKIATASGDSYWITSAQTRDLARRRRDQFDAILVGANTVLKDNPNLNGQRKALKKIILDSSLRISAQAKLFKKTRAANCYIFTTKRASSANVGMFRKRGINVEIYPRATGRIPLRWVLKELAKKEITSILIEGGAQVIGSALKENLVDQMHIYMAPKIIGDQKALSAVDGLGIKKINQAIRLHHLIVKKIGQDIFLEGYVHRHH